jgi:type IV pilus assembly protein PilC
MKFKYRAKNEQGEFFTGQVEASSEEAVIAILQKQELYIISLELIEKEREEDKFFLYRRIKLFDRVPKKDMVLFSRQLSIMFRSKVPLIEALRTFSAQTQNLNFKEKILRISQEVEGGIPFSRAIALYPKVFSPFYIAMVKAGEVSGKLADSLDYLAEHIEREYHLTSKVKSALIYPSLIILVIVVVLLVMIFKIIPQFVLVLEGLGRPLPFITRVIIDLSEGVQEWFLIIIIAIAVIVGTIVYCHYTKKGKDFFHRFYLKLPIMGEVLKMVYVARFAENLSTLIAGGLPITLALIVIEGIIDNVAYKGVIFKTQEAVKKGETISSVLSNHFNLFPPVFVQMVLIGEKTGTLSTILLNIVSFFQKEVERTIDAALSLLEPALIIFLGVVVAIIVLAVLMPLFEGIRGVEGMI